MTRPLRSLSETELYYIRLWSREAGAAAVVEAATNTPRRKRGRPKKLRTIEDVQLVQNVEMTAEIYRARGSKAPIADALKEWHSLYRLEGRGLSFDSLARRYRRGKSQMRGVGEMGAEIDRT